MRRLEGEPDLGPRCTAVRSEEHHLQKSNRATQLSTVRSDPHFDPGVPVAYYLRVLAIPTPRWSTIVSVKRGHDPGARLGTADLVRT
jgi:hypothetical protein